MEIKGTVKQLLPVQSGEGRNGTWRKQEFIVEIPGQYPKSVCMHHRSQTAPTDASWDRDFWTSLRRAPRKDGRLPPQIDQSCDFKIRTCEGRRRICFFHANQAAAAGVGPPHLQSNIDKRWIEN